MEANGCGEWPLRRRESEGFVRVMGRVFPSFVDLMSQGQNRMGFRAGRVEGQALLQAFDG